MSMMLPSGCLQMNQNWFKVWITDTNEAINEEGHWVIFCIWAHLLHAGDIFVFKHVWMRPLISVQVIFIPGLFGLVKMDSGAVSSLVQQSNSDADQNNRAETSMERWSRSAYKQTRVGLRSDRNYTTIVQHAVPCIMGIIIIIVTCALYVLLSPSEPTKAELLCMTRSNTLFMRLWPEAL